MKTILQPVKRATFSHTTGTAKTRQEQGKKKLRPMRKRGENSLCIQITTTQPMIEMVDRIMDTGLFGTSRAAAAERIMCEGVRIILKENPFIRIKKILI